MKRLKLLTIALFLSIFQIIQAQITEAEKELKSLSKDTLEGWKTGGIISFTLAQTTLSNWSAGGQNSLSMNGMFRTFANYKRGNKQWDNNLDLGYGLLRQGEETKYMKTDDKIEITSKYGQRAYKNFYYAGLVNAKSQFSAGYNYPNDSVKISDWATPAYLTLALGIDYKPNSYFSAFLAPVTGRFTLVSSTDLANKGAFGVDSAKTDGTGNILTPGKHLKEEFGGYFRVAYAKNDFKSELMKNIGVISKVELFSNYIKTAQNIDVNWETLIGLKVNKFIVVNFTFNLLYDDDTKTTDTDKVSGITSTHGAKLQLKEMLGVGLAYKW